MQLCTDSIRTIFKVDMSRSRRLATTVSLSKMPAVEEEKRVYCRTPAIGLQNPAKFEGCEQRDDGHKVSPYIRTATL